ncbi:zinc finger, CCHC-type containing protein [Tanacetum coccineum]
MCLERTAESWYVFVERDELLKAQVPMQKWNEFGSTILTVFFEEEQNLCGDSSHVVRLPDPKRKTLGEKGIDCIFVGYVEHSKVYRFYVIKLNDSVSINSIIESRDAISDENRFSSIPRPKDVIPNSVESQRDDHLMMYQLRDQEIKMDHNTLTAIVLRKILEPIMKLCCIWIFQRKMKVDGTIDKFKARLVIQSFRQMEWIDYFDTYALVARITTIRLLLVLAAIQNLVIYQMDVKTAFLNGDLKEVYMKQPKGFVMPGNEHMVCKLVKSLCGLKQAPKQWHQKFDKDMGEADVILGIKIIHENKGIVITQSHYIEKIFKKFNREDCSPVSTLMDPVEKLKPNTGKPVDQLEYSRAIGCLMYVMTSTRPDIAYIVGRLSRFTSNPCRQHWHAITRASKKQTCITSSTMKSEFVALGVAGKEAE